MGNNKLKFQFLMIVLLTCGMVYWLMNHPLKLGLDLQGGMRMVLQAKDTKDIKVDNDAMLGIVGVLRSRIDGLGVSEPVIQRKGERQVVVELPGIKDPDRAIKLVGETALLEFVEGEWSPADVSKLTPENLKILAGDGARLASVPVYDNKGELVSEKAIILKKTVLTGAHLKKARPDSDQYGRPVVGIEFTAEGATLFKEVTARNIGKPLAIILDGKIISAPNIQDVIPGGKAIITGSFSTQEVKDLVIKLKAGSLPVPVEIVENMIVGPTLGQDSIDKSKTAGMWGFILVAIFMILYYRLPGFLADISLIIYIIFNLAALSLIGATLTLPGIAGIILSMGMAVDANILIFERLKDELRLGKTMKSALEAGFRRAMTTIIDSNVTTIIPAVLLILWGTASVKGFGVTLTIGILISMFSAITITRVFMEMIIGLRAVKSGILVRG